MKTLLKTTGILAAIFLFLLSINNTAFTQNRRDDFGGKRFQRQHDGLWTKLTDEQRKELQEKIKTLREQNATPEEIKTAVKDMLQGWGIELPENWEGRPGFGRFGHRADGVFSQLTEEQRKAVHEKIKELRGQDASREEIHVAVKEMLQSWGIELPEDWEGRPGFGRFGHRADGVFSQLTEQQRKAVHEKIKELRDQNATPEEIKAAIKQMLEGYGIQLPADWGERGRFPFTRPRGKGIFSQLTDEQRKELHEEIKTLREQDASREDVKAAVKAILEGWGIELPENWEQMPGFRPFRHGQMRFMRQLTEEQRKQVRDKIKELRDQGATREEIHTAIRELLKQFGIEPKSFDPEDESQSSLNQEVEKAMIDATNHPNPFNPETNISYTLQNTEHVKVSIYNVQGQLIRTLVDETQPAGSYTVRWDGRQENGEMAVSGMYLYRIDAGAQTLTQKMTLMK